MWGCCIDESGGSIISEIARRGGSPIKVPIVNRCQCLNCQQEEAHPDKKRHHQINLFVSRLNEQQRRWYVALEAERLGHGGEKQLSEITGMDEKTIRSGLSELSQELEGRPTDGIRQSGSGRLSVEKKGSPDRGHLGKLGRGRNRR